MAYSIRLHFTLVLCPFGFSVLSLLFWSFHFPVFGTASQFAVFVQVTRWIFSYKVYSRQGLPASKRWKRHYLLMFSLTGFTIEVLVSISRFGSVDCRAVWNGKGVYHGACTSTSMKLKLIGFVLSMVTMQIACFKDF
ncbi:hypothetical protein HanRHA438_MTg0865361 (mitochondrion) [Helianthus annuus]|nr:hypothetical protein HanRHA438_MTg0865361 [Helianthus annuus]